jgi:two-component sensor histidine kinase
LPVGPAVGSFFATLVHHRRPQPVPPRTKFGALSIPTGRVDVAWTIDEQRLRLVWTERGGPLVEPPTRRSFGTRMMESLGQQLNGQVQLAYEPSGFVYSLDVPLSSIIAA